MKLLTLSLKVYFSVSAWIRFHREEYHRASNTIDNFLWKRHQCPLLPQFYVSVILNYFDKTFFHGILPKETDVMFSHGTFATVKGIRF